MATSNPGNYPWQTVKRRNRPQPSHSPTTIGQSSTFSTPNPFEKLLHLSETDRQAPASAPPAATNNDHKTQPRIQKPPPIFMYGVTNYSDMVKYLAVTLEEEQYYCVSLPNETVKINVNSPDSYRELVKRLRADNIVHHTYQIRNERAYRVVIRNLHHSLPLHDIKAEIEALGHKVRNILNIRHRVSKEPLPLYFVDLEPQDNNQSIYDLQLLCNMKIVVEAPRKKNHIVQCTRCQSYGHTRSYCSRPYACVKCGGEHNSTSCVKDPTTPATCALCGGDHPASYKGCVIYKNLQQARSKTHRPTHLSTAPTAVPPVNTSDPHLFPPLPRTPHPAPVSGSPPLPYSRIVSHHSQPVPTTDQLSTFLVEFKTMFNQFIQQNGMLLNMLNTVMQHLTR